MSPKARNFLILIAAVSLLWVVLISAPLHFREGTIMTVGKGQSVKQIAHEFKSKGIIQSETVFTNLIVFFNLDSKIVSGDYAFKEKINTLEVIKRLSTGEYQIQAKRITLIEGITVQDMATLFSENFYNVSRDEFIAVASSSEGYLFPDTYYFPENVRSDEIVQKLRLTFDEKITEHPEILSSEKSIKDIVIMASILEKEATSDSMQEVSNILWKRIEEDMPLQVDAGFVYERGKHTFELSLDDLKKDSEYNTYTRLGLTPTPISNPGIQALLAAAFPEETENFYFLTGHDGKMYYAKTLKEHDANKEKYLRKEEE
jgi:UPF0755 protein